MADMTNKEKLKIVLREKDMPFFSDSDLDFYLAENKNDVQKAAYKCLIIKSENTSLSIPGMTTADTSKYFLRLAKMYAPNNTGTLKGG